MQLPARWAEVLTALQDAGFTEAFIGGGALRDLDNGRPAKDVDIFVRVHPHRTYDMLQRVFGHGGVDQTEHKTEYQAFFPEVAGVYEFDADDPPFNVISCNGPDGDQEFLLHHLARFDLGICGLACPRPGTIFRTAEYVRDKANQTITIVNPVRLPRSIERARRIQRRAYRDWAVMLPDGSSIRLGTKADEDFDFP